MLLGFSLPPYKEVVEGVVPQKPECDASYIRSLDEKTSIRLMLGYEHEKVLE